MELPKLNNVPAVARVQRLTSKPALKDAIWRHHGIATLICAELDITYAQFHRAVRKWGLEEDVRNAKQDLMERAYAEISAILESSKSESSRLKAAELVLRQRGGQAATEVTVNRDGDVDIRTIFGIGDK